MPLWDQSIEVLRESIFAYSQMCNGNLGWGIVVVTFLARLALLPVGLRLARLAHAHQTAMDRLKPELDAIRVRHKGNAQRIAEESRRVMAREGVSLVPPGFLGSVVQIPVLIALYSAVRQAASVGKRFLWIPSLAKPDSLLTMLVVALTMLSVAAGQSTSSSPHQTVMLLLSGIMATLVLSKMAAGVGLYWGVSSLFGVLQGLVTRRMVRATAA
jgi:YidC/Oxa1 family membrane protein insertase